MKRVQAINVLFYRRRWPWVNDPDVEQRLTYILRMYVSTQWHAHVRSVHAYIISLPTAATRENLDSHARTRRHFGSSLYALLINV